MEADIQPGRAVFISALAGHVWCFAISISAISAGWSLPEGWAANALLAFGIVSAIGFGFIFYKDVRGQDKLLDAHIARHEVLTEGMKPAAQVRAEQVAEDRKTAVPFASMLFVEFIFEHLKPNGDFPTVTECVRGLGWPSSKVQEEFTLIKDAGYIDGRIPYQASGKPILNRERFIQAAKDWNTLREGS